MSNPNHLSSMSSKQIIESRDVMDHAKFTSKSFWLNKKIVLIETEHKNYAKQLPKQISAACL